MPGGEETRGLAVQLLNSISKKNISKKANKLKVVIVIPASVFTAQGSYGSGLKTVLKSNQKFLGDLNSWKQNIVFLITFCERYPAYIKAIQENIKKCLDQEDRIL